MGHYRISMRRRGLLHAQTGGAEARRHLVYIWTNWPRFRPPTETAMWPDSPAGVRTVPWSMAERFLPKSTVYT